MVSRSEVDLLDIRQEFRKNFAKSLYQMIQVKLLFCSQGMQGDGEVTVFTVVFLGRGWVWVELGDLDSEMEFLCSFDMALLKRGTLPMEKCFLPVFTRADGVVFWNCNYSYTIFSYCIISLFLSGFLIVQCFREGAGSREITVGLGVCEVEVLDCGVEPLATFLSEKSSTVEPLWVIISFEWMARSRKGRSQQEILSQLLLQS